MAKIYLDNGDSDFVIANNGTSVFGNTGTESIKINDGVTGVVLNPLVEQTSLAGNIGDYTYQSQPGAVRVIDGTGAQVAMLPANSGGKAIFKDGSAVLSANTVTGAISIGNKVVATVAEVAADATKGTITLADAGLDVTEKSVITPVTPAVTGTTQALTTSTTDVLIGTTANDTLSGDKDTFQNTDRIIDSTTTDADTLTITEVATLTPDVTNVETIDVTISNLATITLDAANILGANQLTVSRGDVVIGGTTLTGNKAVRVDNADSAALSKIVAGAGTTTVDINAAAADKAGLTIDANVATGNVTVDGAATILAGASITTVAIDAVSNTTSTETAKASSITADVAATVTTHAALTGSIVINAAKAATITVNDAQGGATINGATTSTVDSTITVVDVDDSGASITTGTGSATASAKQININIDGGTGVTDTATISAAGVIALDVDGTGAEAVEILSLSGNGAGVTYNLATPATAIVSVTKTGSESVTIAGNESVFAAKTVTAVNVLDLNAGTAGTIDASKWTTVGKVDLGFDNANNAITVSEAATYEVTINQTGLNFDFTTAAKNITVVAGDVNGPGSAAIGTLSVGAFDAAAGATDVGTVSIEASEANFTATGTTLGVKQILTVTGDEDVTLGTVVASSVAAGGSSGIITMTSGTSAKTVVTGEGRDVLTVNAAATVHNIDSGANNDTITITNTADAAQFNAGAGDDTINMNDASAFVVLGGSGDDTFNTATDMEGVIIGGDGTGDTLDIGAATIDFSNNTTFAFSGIEKIDLTNATGTTTFSAAQFANNSTLSIVANGDTLAIAMPATGGSLDASNLTIATASTAVINYTGSIVTDQITGGVQGEGFTQTLGADVMIAGTGTDTYTTVNNLTEAGSGASTGTVVNLGPTAVGTAAVLGSTTNFISGNLTEVAGGKVGYIFAANATANSDLLDTLSGIENVTGSAGIDYIIGSAEGNIIVGNDGADYLDGGDGADYLDGSTGADVDTLIGNAGNDTIVLADTSADKIVEAAAGGTDTLLVTNATLDVSAVEFGVTTTTAANAALAEIEQIVVTAGGTTTFDDDHLDGQAIKINGTAAGTSTLAVVADAGVNVINLSSLTFTAGTYTGVAGTTLTGTAFDATDTITITGNTAVDTITAAPTVDNTITGNGGIDQITLGTGTDTVSFDAVTAVVDRDVVATFTLGTDKLGLDINNTTVTTAAGAIAIVEDEAGAAGNANGATYDLATALATNSNLIDLVTLDNSALANTANADLSAATDGTELLKALVTVGAGNTALNITLDNNGDELYIATVDGGTGYLYYVNTGGNAVAVASEILLVGTFTGVDISGVVTAQTIMI